MSHADTVYIRPLKAYVLFSANPVLFRLLASQIVITGTGLNAFTQVKGWEKSDLAELVAYFESSTKDPFLKKSCIKYIYNNNLDWSKYGISKTLHAKTKGEREQDLQKIRRMLSKVGYVHVQNDRMRFRRNIERIGEIMAYEMSKALTYSVKQVHRAIPLHIGLGENCLH